MSHAGNWLATAMASSRFNFTGINGLSDDVFRQ